MMWRQLGLAEIKKEESDIREKKRKVDGDVDWLERDSV
jgi:hypothetical protein